MTNEVTKSLPHCSMKHNFRWVGDRDAADMVLPTFSLIGMTAVVGGPLMAMWQKRVSAAHGSSDIPDIDQRSLSTDCGERGFGPRRICPINGGQLMLEMCLQIVKALTI